MVIPGSLKLDESPLFMAQCTYLGRHDNQYNDTHNNGTQNKGLIGDTVKMLCHYDECHHYTVTNVILLSIIILIVLILCVVAPIFDVDKAPRLVKCQ